jgi:hypothetical protein
MSTNRTKIDWAYKQAERIVWMGEDVSEPKDRPELVRAIAAILRREAGSLCRSISSAAKCRG